MSAKKNTAFEVSHGDVSAATSKFLQELGEDGKRVVEQMKNDPAYRRRLANFAKADGYNPSISWKRAKEIMGASYLGVEDVTTHFRISLADDEVSDYRDIPFTEAQLLKCKDTHVLFPGDLLSIMEIRYRVPHELFYSQNWYDNQLFATKGKPTPKWYLIRKDEVPSSTSKTWQQQQALLTSDETTPRACEVIFMVMLYFLVTGNSLFEKMLVRCSDLDSQGRRIHVGRFDSRGLIVGLSSDGDYSDSLGLAAARK